jgi:CubicO group peptidase (beta-lactamase class C family)
VILPGFLLATMMLTAGGTSDPDPRFSAVAAMVERGIRRGVYPGAVLVIGRRDTVLYSRGFGRLTWAARSPAPSPSATLWDLASLTKVMATASAVMVLVDRGSVRLDEPVARYLPRVSGGGREQITVRMLLDHTSGLPAYLAFHRLAASRDAAVELLYRQPLVRRPGASAVYSDLNAILLGLLVEKVTTESLDVFTAREVSRPLGLTSTMFTPSLRAGLSIAPSRKVGGRPVAGRVNDDNAFLFGGVAGQAGLFSTGADVARFAQHWLRSGEDRGSIGKPGEGWVSSGTMREFLQRSTASGSRALGWDTPEPNGGRPSIYGALAGPLTYGHTGWTGTMLWIDPVRDLFVVFLTNRSLEPKVRRSLTALRDIRSSVSDLVLSAGGR